ncbi:MAG TPA: hypothetical protein VN253_12350 [Kofleriaceae bacterium]|nr:hypothetical protein [Kofleriaceae bacterium]
MSLAVAAGVESTAWGLDELLAAAEDADMIPRMKAARKVALVGLGLGALGVVFYKPLLGFLFFGFDRARPQNLSPEDEKRWQESLAKRGPLPKMMRTPDGSMAPIVAPDGSRSPGVGSVGNMRGHYG